jgi:hypothetical protein
MIKYIKTNNAWEEIKEACNITINKKEDNIIVKSKFKKRLLMSEHSPIRLLNIIWKWEGLKSWISVHFVRHHIGINHYVESQRDDRTGINRDKKFQDSKVNHKCSSNAQEIINISRKRLCNKTHKETKKEWENFLERLKELEPELYEVCVKECVYRNGLCPEMQSCSYNYTKDFEIELKKYQELLQNQINIRTLI